MTTEGQPMPQTTVTPPVPPVGTREPQLRPPPDVGLSSEEAARRLARTGPNEIRREQATSALRLLLDQFKSALIWLLLVACVVSVILGDVTDAVAIGAIVVINAVVGFLQEYRAERALLALRSMTAPRARVLRDGSSHMLAAREVVPGDVLVLEAGDVVAADARLVEAHNLSTNEAPLTGESMPVAKNTTPTAPDAPLAECHDRVFLGTAVATGTALAEVIATGMSTELGRIAELLQGAKAEETPLQKRLAQVAHLLAVACLVAVALVAIVGLAHGEAWLDVLLTSVSLAVAAVPEGLAAIVTIALAIGVQRLAARNVLVRKLPAVETLGCVTVICTDKTGTLTTGVMRVRELWCQDEQALLFAAAACCDAELGVGGRPDTGDPTEIALLAAARERGVERPAIERALPRTRVTPFDSATKRMAVERSDGVVYMKGALEALLPHCAVGYGEVVEANREMAARGLRVLAIAAGEDERALELLGLVGLADPPRPEAVEAVRAAQRAGVRTVMITGDHPVTAEAIAREMGVLREGEVPDDIVHARATAEDKIQIVREWKQRGEVVAMTGDGVNDAPALREAHIGIAMGRTGTEVTREASDMVLSNDDYASIVAAVREGRGIYESIRKTLVYLLTGNSSELFLMLVAGLIGLPLPLLPLHLLWVNLVTETLPALALVTDPPAPDLLERPPRRPDEPILQRSHWNQVLLTALLAATVCLGAYWWVLRSDALAAARTIALTTLVFSDMFRAFAARSPTRTFWEVGPFTNPKLVAMVIVCVSAQLSLPWIPFTRALFQLEPLTGQQLLVALGLGLVPVSVLETQKLVRRARMPEARA